MLKITAVLMLQTFATLPILAGDYVYYCGNHDPHDVARSEQEVVELTVTNHCKDWTVLYSNGKELPSAEKARVLDALAKLLKDNEKQK